jgi:hypothetical protein
MKTKFAFLIMMTALLALASGQEKKPKVKKPVLPTDTGRSGSVKIPNSYRKGGLEPVPMPTHKIEMLRHKRTLDSSGKRSIEPVPMPNHKVEPVKPKKK